MLEKYVDVTFKHLLQELITGTITLNYRELNALWWWLIAQFLQE